MDKESPIGKLLNNFSDTNKRLCAFIINPSIENSHINKNILRYSLVDFFMSLIVVFIIIRLIKTLLPSFLTINPLALFNLDILGLMFITNVLLFSLIFYLIFFMIGKTKNIENINLLFYQAIKTYSILNFIIVIMFIMIVNKLMTNNMNNWGVIETIFALLLTITLIYLIFRLLINPVSIFLMTYFSKKISYLLSFTILVFATYINQPIFTNYFINVIDKEAFCKQYVEINFKADIIHMTKNKDCMIGKCLQVMEN